MPWNLLGNARAAAAVARSLASENPPHAYLFTGPERVGKHALAIQLAQALNCERTVGADHDAPMRLDDTADVAPCGECRACTRIDSGIHADIAAVTLELNDDGEPKTAIAVEQVRDIERAIALSPFEGRARVVIVDPADLLNDAAQNAFLKTLEEPPPHVVIILIATREDCLLPTVHSRCRRIEFQLVPAAEIEAALVAGGTAAEQTSLLARLARGRPGWALEIARDPGALERRHEILEIGRSLASMPLQKRMSLAEKLAIDFRTDRETMYARLAEWAGWWRDVMLVQAGAGDGVANADMVDSIRGDAERYSRPEVIDFVEAILAAVEHLRANVQPRPALELLVLEAPAGR